MQCQTGRVLILAATPIGNLSDVTHRLVEALSTVTVIAAEDTRTTVKLIRALEIDNKPELIALHDHNETARAADIAARALDSDVLVLSDAGMPTVSDPGYHLVQAAIAAGVQVSALPGPSAVLTALAVSGLPTDRFVFEGFASRRPSTRKNKFQKLEHEERTMVFFESPHRLADFLADAAEVFGAERSAAVCRELTKLYEEVKRGTLAELAAWASQEVKGEIVVVIAGAEAATATLESGLAQVHVLVASGIRLKEATAEVAAATGLSARELYNASLTK